MKTLKLYGDYRSVGEQMGRQLKEEIETVLKGFKGSPLYTRIETFLKTPEGGKIYDAFIHTTSCQCSDYVEQLEGVASGAGVPYKDLFILNLEPEWIALFADNPSGSHGVQYLSLYSGCTNVCVSTSTNQLCLVHTEDVAVDAMDQGAMIDVTISKDSAVVESFVVFIIPGVIEGSTFGFNGHGLAHAHNNIYQKGICLKGIPRRFILRKMLSMTCPQKVHDSLVLQPGIATGFNCLFIWRGEGKHAQCLDMEVSGQDTGPRVTVHKPTTFYFHLNMFQHLDHECHPEESSIHRAALLCQYSYSPPPDSKEQLIQLISNQQDTAFPMYRSGKHPDYLATAATGLFDMEDMVMEVYTSLPVHSRPTARVHVPYTTAGSPAERK